MEELNQMVQLVAKAIRERIDLVGFQPSKYDLWLHFIRLEDGAEREVLPATKRVEEATTESELLYKVAEQVVLAVFGSEITVVTELPNLMVRLLDHRATVHLPGAPALDQPDQIFLKVSLSRHEPGLWQRLFGGNSKPE